MIETRPANPKLLAWSNKRFLVIISDVQVCGEEDDFSVTG
jgi:hypothetical protein